MKPSVKEIQRRKELVRRNIQNGCSGGFSYEKMHHIYIAVKKRCEKEGDKDYIRYGGRGIKLLWKTYVEFRSEMRRGFLAHAKIHGEHNTTLERIDSNGNYCKENCKWATRQEQALNRRTSRFIEHNGKKKNVATWAKEMGIHRQTLRYRLESGWTHEQIIKTPVSYSNKIK